MGDFKKHLEIAKEKLSALKSAFDKKQFTVVGDLATKVCEQLIAADASRDGKHFGTHLDRLPIQTKNILRKSMLP